MLPSPRARALAHLASALVLGGVLTVVPFKDDERWFPLSRYPMFAFNRPNRETLPYVDVVLADGDRRRLGYTWWTAGGVSTARNQLERMEDGPRGPQSVFCNRVAARIAASTDTWARQAKTVQVRSGTFQARRIIHDSDASPRTTRTLAECPVVRTR